MSQPIGLLVITNDAEAKTIRVEVSKVTSIVEQDGITTIYMDNGVEHRHQGTAERLVEQYEAYVAYHYSAMHGRHCRSCES